MFIYLSICECRLILQVWTWHHNAKLVNCMEEGGVHRTCSPISTSTFLHHAIYYDVCITKACLHAVVCMLNLKQLLYVLPKGTASLS